MAVYTLQSNEYNYTSTLVPTAPETANAIYGNSLSNVIVGNGYVDFIHGGLGNDSLFGAGGNDVLIGDGGSDSLNGGSGDDLIVGDNTTSGGGNDTLYGGSGTDRLYGNTGNDYYLYAKADGGIDTINDDFSAANSTGFGGGTDTLQFADVLGADLRLYTSGNNLIVTDVADIADGYINTGVVITDFLLGGNNRIEYIVGSDGYGWSFV